MLYRFLIRGEIESGPWEGDYTFKGVTFRCPASRCLVMTSMRDDYDCFRDLLVACGGCGALDDFPGMPLEMVLCLVGDLRLLREVAIMDPDQFRTRIGWAGEVLFESRPINANALALCGLSRSAEVARWLRNFPQCWMNQFTGLQALRFCVLNGDGETFMAMCGTGTPFSSIEFLVSQAKGIALVNGCGGFLDWLTKTFWGGMEWSAEAFEDLGRRPPEEILSILTYFRPSLRVWNYSSVENRLRYAEAATLALSDPSSKLAAWFVRAFIQTTGHFLDAAHKDGLFQARLLDCRLTVASMTSDVRVDQLAHAATAFLGEAVRELYIRVPERSWMAFRGIINWPVPGVDEAESFRAMVGYASKRAAGSGASMRLAVAKALREVLSPCDFRRQPYLFCAAPGSCGCGGVKLGHMREAMEIAGFRYDERRPAHRPIQPRSRRGARRPPDTLPATGWLYASLRYAGT